MSEELKITTKEELITLLQNQTKELNELKTIVDGLKPEEKPEEKPEGNEEEKPEGNEEEITEKEIDEIDALLNMD